MCSNLYKYGFFKVSSFLKIILKVVIYEKYIYIWVKFSENLQKEALSWNSVAETGMKKIRSIFLQE